MRAEIREKPTQRRGEQRLEPPPPLGGTAKERLEQGGPSSLARARSSPLAAPGVTETEIVLDLIRAVKQHGVPVIVISNHDLPEVFQVADRIQVLRVGQPAGIAHPGRDAPDDVVRMMAGLDAA